MEEKRIGTICKDNLYVDISRHMLLVGDMHMTSARGNTLLDETRAFILSYPEEREIVFMGDYVYHFSYDRKALLLLFGFFAEMCASGKKVHVMAGNHDRIADHFVYEEARQALALHERNTAQNSLIFYTEPGFQTIDGQECLIFPFFHPSLQQKRPIEITKFKELADSEHRQEQYAAYANELLQNMIDERKRDHADARAHTDVYTGATGSNKLVVLHHWYIAQTRFPGVIGTFPYKSPALSPHRLDDEQLRLISGHIHMPFVMKNYLCVGSMRHTSPLEVNQQKRGCVYTPSEDSLEITPLQGFPYILLQYQESEGTVSKAMIEKKFEDISQEKASLMKQGIYSVQQKSDISARKRSEVTLTLQGEQMRYDALHQTVNQEFLEQLGDIKVKQIASTDKDMQALLQVGGEELQRRLSSRKELLQKYLQQKYGERADTYLELLKTLNILG